MDPVAGGLVTGGRVERRLAAVLAADVAGYSRLMGADEVGTLSALKSIRREVVDPVIAAHKGRIVKTTGDGMLVEFSSAVDAVTCALAVQDKMAERDSGHAPKIAFRIGINVGDVIIDGDDIFGDGVNVAARVENECEPGGVYLSGNAFEQVRGKPGFAFDDLGERSLKNIERPVRLFAAHSAASSEASTAKAKTSIDISKPLALPDKPSVAVLPFDNMSADPEQGYFADGLVEDIITALSRFRSLFVIARNSSFTYKGKAVDIKQIGRELGVRYVLEGSVRRAASRLRITGQLIDVMTGAHLWADRFDGALDDLFELQEKVTLQVVGAVAPELDRAEIDRASRRATGNVDAVTEYYRGLPAIFWPTSSEKNDIALRHFENAMSIDPSFPQAYGGAAACFAYRRALKWPRDNAESAAHLFRYAARIKELDVDDAFTLGNVGFALYVTNVDFDAGAELVDRAIQSNPNYARAYGWRGFVRVWDGESDTAIADFEQAMRLSPRDPFNFNTMLGLAWGHYNAGRYAEAALWADKSLLAGPPNYSPGIAAAVVIYVGAGRLEDARRMMADCLRLRPGWRRGSVEEHVGARSVELRERMRGAFIAAGLPE
jgi:adenylate cyclase